MFAVVLGSSLQAMSFARAAPPESSTDGATRQAEEQYGVGVAALQRGDAAAALAALDASLLAKPSPNAALVRGHALRALGRKIEAMGGYEGVVRDAGALVRAGDARFESTLADAGTWIAFLKQDLVDLSVEAHSKLGKVEIRFDGGVVATSFDAQSGTTRAHEWRVPGRVAVSVFEQGVEQRKRTLDLRAGAVESMRVDLARPEETWGPPPAAWVAFAVGGAGFTTLAIAGGLARAGMSELDACTPWCTEDDVTTTRTQAIVANVGLGVGIAGLVAGAIVLIVDKATTSSAPRVGSEISSDGAFFSIQQRF